MLVDFSNLAVPRPSAYLAFIRLTFANFWLSLLSI